MTTTAKATAQAKASKIRIPPVFGLVGRFDTPEALVEATKSAYVAGYRQMDAYSPVPVEGLASALGRKGTAMPLIMLLGGIAGGLTGFFVQWYSAVVDYPFNIGGRPFNSWVSWIPITFEATVLVLGDLRGGGHAVFERVAALSSSDLQRARHRTGIGGPILFVHRVERHEMGRGGDAAFPGG